MDDNLKSSNWQSFQSTLTGHSNDVFVSTIFHPYILVDSNLEESDNKNKVQLVDEPFLITGGSINLSKSEKKGEIIVWNDLANGGKLFCKIYGHDDYISAISSYTRGHYEQSQCLITGSADKNIIVWKYLHKNKSVFSQLYVLRGHSKIVTSIAVYYPVVSMNSFLFAQIVSSSQDRTVRIWGIATGEIVRVLEIFDAKSSSTRQTGYTLPANTSLIDVSDDAQAYSLDNKKSISQRQGYTYSNVALNDPVIESQLKAYNDELIKFKLERESKKRRKSFALTNLETDNEIEEEEKDDGANRLALIKRKMHKLQESIQNDDDDDSNPAEIPDQYRHIDFVNAIVVYSPKGSCLMTDHKDIDDDHYKSLIPKQCSKHECVHLRKPIIITGSWDRSIIFWDLKSGKSLFKLFGHTKAVTYLTICDPKDGSSPILVSGSLDKRIIIWDILEATKIRVLPRMDETGHSDKVNCLAAYDPTSYGNSPFIASCSDDKSIIIWDLLSGRKIREMKNAHYNPIYSLCIYYNGETNLSNVDGCGRDSQDYTIKNENYTLISTGKSKSICFMSFTSKLPINEIYFAAITHLIVIDPSPKTCNPIAIVGDIQNNVTIWDVITARKLYTLLDGHTSRVNNVAAHINEATSPGYEIVVATCGHDWKVIIRVLKKDIDPNSTSEYIELTKKVIDVGKFFLSINFVCFVPDPTIPSVNELYLVIGGGNQDATKLVNVVRFLAAQYESIKLFDLRDGTLELPPVHTDTIRAIMAFKAPDGTQRLVTGSYDKSAIIWRLDKVGFDKTTVKLVHHLTGLHNAVVFALCMFFPKKKVSLGTNKSVIIAPQLVTGSFDNTVILWDTQTGEPIRKFCGHSDSVTGVSIYSPNNDGPSLLLSTGIDKIIIVWNLESGEILRKLISHTDRVCCLDVYAPTIDSTNTPIIVSGSDDKTLTFWKDALQNNDFMPLQGVMTKIFNFDGLADDNWSSIEEYSEKYGFGLWIENSHLFFLALEKNFNNFFQKFKNDLMLVLTSMNRKKVIVGYNYSYGKNYFLFEDQSLLKFALNKENLFVIKIILFCWKKLLLTNINDPLTQRMFHPSYFLEKEDLLTLSIKFPNEFISFISSIHLVRAYPSVNNFNKKLNIRDHSRCIIGSSSTKSSYDVWKGIVNEIKKAYFSGFSLGKVRDGQQVTPLYLPLKDAAHREMLNAYVRVSNNEHNVDIFDGDVGIRTIAYIWKQHAMFSHVIATCKYLIFLVVFSMIVYSYLFVDAFKGDLFVMVIFTWTMQFLLCIYLIYYLIEEMLQVVIEINENEEFHSKYGTKRHGGRIALIGGILKGLNRHFLHDIWNFVDLIIIIATFAGIALRFTFNFKRFKNITQNRTFLLPPRFSNVPSSSPVSFLSTEAPSTYPTSKPSTSDFFAFQFDSTTSACMLAIASIAVYFKVLYFMKPFKASGTLGLIVAKDTRYLFLVLIIMIGGFAMSFSLLAWGNGFKFSSVKSAYFQTFIFMMGQVNVDEFLDGAEYYLSIGVLIFFTVFMSLLLLNLLIAIINDSYSVMKSRGLAEWRLSQASIVLDSVDLGANTVGPYLHCLVYSSDLQVKEDNPDEFVWGTQEKNENKESRKKIQSIEEKVDLSMKSVSISNNIQQKVLIEILESLKKSNNLSEMKSNDLINELNKVKDNNNTTATNK